MTPATHHTRPCLVVHEETGAELLPTPDDDIAGGWLPLRGFPLALSRSPDGPLCPRRPGTPSTRIKARAALPLFRQPPETQTEERAGLSVAAAAGFLPAATGHRSNGPHLPAPSSFFLCYGGRLQSSNTTRDARPGPSSRRAYYGMAPPRPRGVPPLPKGPGHLQPPSFPSPRPDERIKRPRCPPTKRPSGRPRPAHNEGATCPPIPWPRSTGFNNDNDKSTTTALLTPPRGQGPPGLAKRARDVLEATPCAQVSGPRCALPPSLRGESAGSMRGGEGASANPSV